MKIKLNNFYPLTKSMQSNKKSIEQFYVIYAGVTFDVIFDISNTPYELLIGAIGHNWACTLYMEKGFYVEMDDDIFFALCDILDLRPGRETFTSSMFLNFIAHHAPNECTPDIVDPAHLIRFRANRIREEDERDKIYFKGWNNHKKDKRQARNFDKTESFLGKTVADYCRKHNISSMWSANPGERNIATYPWNNISNN